MPHVRLLLFLACLSLPLSLLAQGESPPATPVPSATASSAASPDSTAPAEALPDANYEQIAREAAAAQFRTMLLTGLALAAGLGGCSYLLALRRKRFLPPPQP